MRILIPLFFFLVLLAPVPALAADATFFGPLIPPECNCESEGISSAADFGCVLATVQNTTNLIISLSIILAMFYMVLIGFQFITSAGNPGAREAARKRVMNLVFGFLLLLGAWLIVDFIMKTLYKPDASAGAVTLGPWNSILGNTTGKMCLEVGPPPPPLPSVVSTEPPPSTGTGTGGTTGTAGCPSCVPLTNYGLTCKNANSCTLDSSVAPKMGTLKTNFSGTWTVTEAYPPTYNHSNRCHTNGTCIDAGFRGNTTYTVANIIAFRDAASRSGLRAVFETSSCTLRTQVREAGMADAFCSGDRGYGHITGNHFSVYNR